MGYYRPVASRTWNVGSCFYRTVHLGAYRTYLDSGNYRTSDLGLWTLWDQPLDSGPIPLSDYSNSARPDNQKVIGHSHSKALIGQQEGIGYGTRSYLLDSDGIIGLYHHCGIVVKKGILWDMQRSGFQRPIITKKFSRPDYRTKWR